MKNVELSELNILRYPKPSCDHEHPHIHIRIDMPSLHRYPRSNSRLWRTLKTNRETFNGRCHSAKRRAWWAEYFVICGGNCSWFYGIIIYLVNFFFQPTYNTSYTKPRRWRKLQNVQKLSRDIVILKNVELDEVNFCAVENIYINMNTHIYKTKRHAIEVP